jgi:mRNA interferase HigB
VDYDEPRTIFNIAGNNIRLIALVDFNKQLVQVAGVMTHAEYDREN